MTRYVQELSRADLLIQGGLDGHDDVFYEYGDGAALSLVDGPVWSRSVSPSDSPLWRNGSAMMADPARGDLVLYGGLSSGLDAENDMWRYEAQESAIEKRHAWLMGIDEQGERPSISWYAPRLGGASASIEASVDQGPWTRVADVAIDSDGVANYLGASQEPAHEYAYRLDLGGGLSIEGEVHLPVRPGPVALIYGALPTPARGSFEVRFMLPTLGEARLAMYDVQGRRIWEREMEGLSPGVHRVTIADDPGVPPGIYLLRLSTETSVAHGKVVIVR